MRGKLVVRLTTFCTHTHTHRLKTRRCHGCIQQLSGLKKHIFPERKKLPESRWTRQGDTSCLLLCCRAVWWLCVVSVFPGHLAANSLRWVACPAQFRGRWRLLCKSRCWFSSSSAVLESHQLCNEETHSGTAAFQRLLPQRPDTSARPPTLSFSILTPHPTVGCGAAVGSAGSLAPQGANSLSRRTDGASTPASVYL